MPHARRSGAWLASWSDSSCNFWACWCVNELKTDDSLQLRYFLRQQWSVFARRERAEAEGSHAHADELLDEEAQGLKHPPHLTVASLVDFDLEPCLFAQHLDDSRLGGRRPTVFQPNAFPQTLDILVGRTTADFHTVDFFHLIARMHQFLGQRAVVREQ